MNDNDIIMALELLLDRIRAYECHRVSIDKGTITSTLDLINRQKAEITEKDLIINHQADTIKILEQAIKDKLAEIEKKNTEIDILIRKKGTLRDEILELKAEIEKLHENVKYWRAEYEELVERT